MADEPKSAPAEVDLTKHPQFVAVTSTLSKILEGLSKFDNTLNAIGQRVVSLENGPPKGGNDPPDDDLDADLEAMDRNAFATHISANIIKTIKNELFDPLANEMKATRNRVGHMGANDELQAAMTKHKDFGDWRDAIADRLKANDKLGIEDAYKLARADDPKKAKELDEKYDPAPKKFDASLGFYGFGETGNTDAKSGKLDGKQAAEAAWNETMTNLPPA